MKKTSTVRIFASSILETLWVTGVGSVVGHLSTKTHSSHNKANSLGLPKAAPLVPRYAAFGIRLYLTSTTLHGSIALTI